MNLHVKKDIRKLALIHYSIKQSYKTQTEEHSSFPQDLAHASKLKLIDISIEICQTVMKL